MTGIGQEIYKQMLPVMASTLMGGIFKQSLAPFFPGTDAGKASANPFADMMQQWAEATGLAKKPEPANPFAKAFQDMMAGMAGQPAAEKPSTPEASPADSLKSLVNTMFDTGLEMQKDYQRNIETIFETMRGGVELDGGKKA